MSAFIVHGVLSKTNVQAATRCACGKPDCLSGRLPAHECVGTVLSLIATGRKYIPALCWTNVTKAMSLISTIGWRSNTSAYPMMNEM